MQCVLIISTKGPYPKYVVEIGETYLKLFPSKTPITRLKNSDINHESSPMTCGAVLLRLVDMWRDKYTRFSYDNIDGQPVSIASLAGWLDMKTAVELCGIVGKTGIPVVLDAIVHDAYADDDMPATIYLTNDLNISVDGTLPLYFDNRPPILRCLMDGTREQAFEFVAQLAR